MSPASDAPLLTKLNPIGRRTPAFYRNQVIRGRAGPADATPTYDDTRLLDRVLLGLFRSKLAEEVGGDGDVYEPGYDGLMEMIRVLNEKYPSKRQTQEASR